MKKVKDILKYNKEYDSKLDERLREAVEFMKENEGQGFTNEEISERFDVTFPVHLRLYLPHLIFKNVASIREMGTFEEYFFYRSEKEKVKSGSLS